MSEYVTLGGLFVLVGLVLVLGNLTDHKADTLTWRIAGIVAGVVVFAVGVAVIFGL